MSGNKSNNVCFTKEQYEDFCEYIQDEKYSINNFKSRIHVLYKELGSIVERFDEISESYIDKADSFLFDSFDNIEEKEKCVLYYLESETTGFVKIGITNNLNQRLKSLIASSGQEITVLNQIECLNREDALNLERIMHNEFSFYRKRPSKYQKTSEWFDGSVKKQILFYNTREKILALDNVNVKRMKDAMNKIKIKVVS